MTFHANANEYSARNMSQAARNLQHAAEAEEEAREKALVASNQLADMIGYETPEWEAFWRTVPEPSTSLRILTMLEAEIKRVEAENAAKERDWQDERDLHEQLKRGG